MSDRLLASLGLVFTTVYLGLGLASLAAFFLVSCGVWQLGDLDYLRRSYSLLVVVLVVIFLGLVASMLLVVAQQKGQSWQLFPWLSYHVLAILGLTVGGTSLLLHFLVNTKQTVLAGLCGLPVASGLLLILAWIRVYGRFLDLRYLEGLRRKTARLLPYTNSYLPAYRLQPPGLPGKAKVSPRDLYENTGYSSHPRSKVFPRQESYTQGHRAPAGGQEISWPAGRGPGGKEQEEREGSSQLGRSSSMLQSPDHLYTSLSTRQFRSLPGRRHLYTGGEVAQEQVPQLVASVRTLVTKRPPLYFYGDSLGLLAIRNRETIEASLVFEEEEEDIKTGPQAYASGYSLALSRLSPHPGLSSSRASTLPLPHPGLPSSLVSTQQLPWPPSVPGRGQGHASTMTDPSTATLPAPPPPACSSLVHSSLARPLTLPPCQEKGEKQQEQEVEEEDEEGECLTREEIIKIYSTLGDIKE